MKTIISISIALISLVSCSKSAELKQADRYKFFHADTNQEFIFSSSMSKSIQDGKCYRLDLKTGECSQYGKKY